MNRFSYTQSCFEEDLEISVKRLSRLGYSQIEVPVKLPPTQSKVLLTEYGLVCSSVNGDYTRENDICSSNPAVREQAVKYLKEAIVHAQILGAPYVQVVPAYVGKMKPETTLEEEWGYAADTLRQAGKQAKEAGVMLLIEPINRYETYFVKSLDTAWDLISEVGLDSVGLMGDLFHMSLEEDNLEESLKKYAGKLRHMHLADNNRKVIGKGCLPVQHYLEILEAGGYQGTYAIECAHQITGSYHRSEFQANEAVYDDYARTAIDLLISWNI